jgi:hypothetical protein
MTAWRSSHCGAPRGATLVVATAFATSLLLPQVARAGPVSEDYDCTDFDSRADAQQFFEENGGPTYDPFNLDDDADGTACVEWALSYEQTTIGRDGINGRDGLDRDCADFANPAEAQRYFEDDGGTVANDVDHLDPNHNGVACEVGEPG